MAELIEILLHAIAGIDDGIDFRLLCFAEHVEKHFADLGEAALAGDGGHEAREALRVAHPFAGAGLAEAAEIDELHVEGAGFLDGLEHVALQLQSDVPGRLPAHGGVHGKDQPPASAIRRRRHCPHALQETVDLGAARAGLLEHAGFRLDRRLRLSRHLIPSSERKVAANEDGPAFPKRQWVGYSVSPPAARRLAFPPEAVRSVLRTRSSAKALR